MFRRRSRDQVGYAKRFPETEAGGPEKIYNTSFPVCATIAVAKEARMVKPVPDGYHTITPYLIVSAGAKALEFYKRAFAAVERERMQDAAGKVRHAELEIGDSRIMLADENLEVGALSPATIGGSAVSIHLYVEDVDVVVANAVAAGAKLTRPVADQFYGDRIGGITDPFGHRWFIATHKEDLTREEIRRRAMAQER
jgi:PhnB protein